MKLPLSWLKDFVQTENTAEEIAKKLLSCGFEVEEIIYKGKDIKNVVAGRILSIEKHPDADKLLVLKMDTGGAAPLQIVTGAHNISVNDIVPVALSGSTLPGGVKIKSGKLRGVLSEGMLCSGAELNITDDEYEGASTDGILIIKENVEPGTDIKKVLGLDEYILDISITANRPDCQSIIGISREAAAALNLPFKPLNIKYNEDSNDDISGHLKAEVLSPTLCPRYMAKYVKDIKIFPSPDWMKKRLRLCGIRPVNCIVDITNYVLLEMGQPMHAFDSRYINGGSITVRNARQDEKIVTLNSKENILSENMLVICGGDVPVAVAGIMGGENSGIKDDTKAVILESAKFARDSIRKTSRTLSLRSDSSFRFEKGIDADSCEVSLNRALALIDELKCGTVVSGVIDIKSEEIKQRQITVNKEKLDSLLGIDIEKAVILKILNSLNFNAKFSGNILSCDIPPYRDDIEGYADIAEEIIRLYGYDYITPSFLKGASVTKGGKNIRHKNADRLKDIMTAQGCNEVMTYTFINENAFDKLLFPKECIERKVVKIKNPLSEQMAVMRTVMAHSMLEVVANNCKKKVENGRLFEIGNIYIPKSLPVNELPDEKEFLCFALFGRDEDFYTAKGIADNISDSFGLNADYVKGNYPHMHGGRCADIICNGKTIGYFGQVHPDVCDNYDIKQKVYIGEIDFSLFSENIRYYGGYVNIPKFPEIDRDLALVVNDEITCREITDEIKKSGGALLQSVELFDFYKGGQVEEGKKSLAFSLKLRAEDRTLKIEEADSVIENIIASLKNKFNANLR